MRKLLYFVLTFLPADAVFARENSAEVQETAQSGHLHINVFVVMLILTVIILLIASLAILKAVKTISSELKNPTPYVKNIPQPLEYQEWAAQQKLKPGVLNKLLGLKPISEEKDIMLEHEFDGIVELDNPTPTWFMGLFYGTIAFAAVYLLYFHVLGYGKLQDDEYIAEMQIAKIEQAAYLAKSANNIDENSVKPDADGTVINAGQALFNTNCVACHGDKGQGIVGPNLTDDYWLHGGTINNVFKTIKYGVPEKGMISWERTLTPKQISDVSNYILSLHGTNPPNAKAPQGDKEG